MATGYRFTVHGLETWQSRLNVAKTKLPYYVKDANRQASGILRMEIIRRMERQFVVPRARRTNRLVQSVFTDGHAEMKAGGNSIQLVGTIGRGIDYAGWWEYGYERDEHPPPFRLFAPRGRTIYPALRRKGPQIQAIYVGVARRLSNHFGMGRPV